MARKARNAAAQEKAETVQEDAATAATGTLGFALQVLNDPDSHGATRRVNDLAELCDQAADHMALAHNLLVTHENHTDTAIEHLDAALGCLKELMSKGEKRVAGKKAKAAKTAAVQSA